MGQTVYVVRYHFNEDATETMQEKINRMLVTEASRMAVY
ncbi:MAG: transposon-encoded TnpW family protein [Mediterraneibacter gnavus]